MPKFVFMPPQDGLKPKFSIQLADSFPELDVVSPKTDEEALEAIKDADAAMGWIPPEALKVAKNLKWLHNPDAGPFFGYFYDELIKHSLTITNPRGIYWDHISHHVLMFLLALSRGLPWFENSKREKLWKKDARKTPYIFLGEATALINGVGGIGHETARLCLELGMNVIGIDPRPEYKLPGLEIFPPQDIEKYLPKADFVISTVPHTPETELMFNRDIFKLMKNTSYFINVGRGKVCSIDDLAEAIESGQIAGCGLDVFEIEPLPTDHKLWILDNVLITPHIAVADAENLPNRRYQVLADNVRNFLSGNELANVVDKEKWF